MKCVKAVLAAPVVLLAFAAVILTLFGRRRDSATSPWLPATSRALRSLGGHAPSDGQCKDLPRWKCTEYAKNKWCTPDGEPGPGWKDEWGDIRNTSLGGTVLSVVDACCTCGGGLYNIPCTDDGAPAIPESFYFKVGDVVSREARIGIVERLDETWKLQHAIYAREFGVITKLAAKGIQPKDGVCAVLRRARKFNKFEKGKHGYLHSGGVPVKCPAGYEFMEFIVDDEDHVSKDDIVARASKRVGENHSNQEVDCRAPESGYIWTKHFHLPPGVSVKGFVPGDVVAVIGPSQRHDTERATNEMGAVSADGAAPWKLPSLPSLPSWSLKLPAWRVKLPSWRAKPVGTWSQWWHGILLVLCFCLICLLLIYCSTDKGKLKETDTYQPLSQPAGPKPSTGCFDICFNPSNVEERPPDPSPMPLSLVHSVRSPGRKLSTPVWSF